MNRLAVITKFDIGQDGTVTGVAWPFGTPDRYGDVIDPGAFKSAAGGTLPMLFNHDPDKVVEVWDSLTEKADGLHISGRLLHDAIPLAAEVRAMLQAGAVKGLSIGFRPLSSSPRKNGGRTFKSVDLLEVSIVPVPAHANARVTAVKSPTPAKAVAAAFFKAAAAFR